MPEILRGGITINEVLVDPNSAGASFDTDGSGRARGGDEFLELKNISNVAIDISGLELWDAQRGNWFTFPSGSVLQPGAHAIVVRNVQGGGSLPTEDPDDLAFDADLSSGVFNNNRDNITVYDPDADEFIQAVYNNDVVDDPPNDYTGFSSTATLVGSVEDFGTDIDGFSIQRTDTGFANDGVPTPGAQNVCFVSGTRILTTAGFRPIETIRPGDVVWTKDAGPQPVEWLFARHVSPEDLAQDPRLQPVALQGQGIGQAPGSNRRLLVSRHHRIELRGRLVKRMFGTPSILAPAKDLVGAPGMTMETGLTSFFYFHLLLGGHHIINAEGFAAESLFMGPQAQMAFSDDAWAELQILFPDGLPEEVSNKAASPHRMVRGAKVRQMVQRYSRQDRPLMTSFAAA